MIRALYTAASGMLLGMRQQDVVADNISNASTVAYKADQSAQSAFAGVLARRIGPSSGPMPETSESVIGRVGTGAFVENVKTFLGQGAERETGQPLDAMIRGEGFFVVRSPEGQTLYTRDGHFDRDDQQRLITADGSMVLDAEGNEIVLDTDRVRIKPDGTLSRLIVTETPQQDGSISIDVTEELVARLQVVGLPAESLVRAGGSKFLLAGGEPAPIDFAQGATFVLQGSLEEANVNVGQAATQLYSVARTFQSSQRVFSEINKSLEVSVTELGRV